MGFPDWEILPYDVFSPLPELLSERLLTLHRLPGLTRGVLVVPVATLLQRLPPQDSVDGQSLVLAVGDRLDLDATRRRLERAGDSCVSQVMGHGEFAVRGSLLDSVYPTNNNPLIPVNAILQRRIRVRPVSPQVMPALAETLGGGRPGLVFFDPLAEGVHETQQQRTDDSRPLACLCG